LAIDKNTIRVSSKGRDERGVELRFAPSLWSLREAVVTSTLRFSIIRLRNALSTKDRL
jgi:hypothetical protein